MHYPVAEASLKKVIHDCSVEQDNSPLLKFRQPFPSTGCVCRNSLHPLCIMWPVWCSCTFTGNLGHPPGTVSCHKVSGEPSCAPSSPARCCCCRRSCGQWLLSPRETKSHASQFSPHPGDRLWLFSAIWMNTQDPLPGPLHSLWHTVIIRARVLNKSLS